MVALHETPLPGSCKCPVSGKKEGHEVDRPGMIKSKTWMEVAMMAHASNLRIRKFTVQGQTELPNEYKANLGKVKPWLNKRKQRQQKAWTDPAIPGDQGVT